MVAIRSLWAAKSGKGTWNLTLPGGCHHNPDPLLNIIHIRKILPYYLNNNGGGFPVVVSCIKLTAKLCHHQKCTHLKGCREALDGFAPIWIWIHWTLHWLHTLRNDDCIKISSIVMWFGLSWNWVHVPLLHLVAHKLLLPYGQKIG